MQQNHETPDGELVGQALAGDARAADSLARRWAPRVVACCRARVGNVNAVEDLAQEALLRGFRSLEELRDPGRFGAWLRGIAGRVCLDWLKNGRRRQVPFSSLGDNHQVDAALSSRADAAESPIDAADAAADLLRQVDGLPDEYREVLLLYYYDDVTYHDLAELLGVSAATVNARLTKARALLRRRMSCPRS